MTDLLFLEVFRQQTFINTQHGQELYSFRSDLFSKEEALAKIITHIIINPNENRHFISYGLIFLTA